jgi:glycosyltransferase involved in cell wall biosynthesis
MNETIEAIAEGSFNSIIIQHNWGFFSTNQLIQLLEQLDNLRIIIEFHSLRDDQGRAYKQFSEIRESLRGVDRILVHDLWDVNFLVSQGFVDHVVYFPHPFPDYGHEINHDIARANPIRIGTSGFALPHKGHEELIAAVDILKNWGISVELTLQTPEHPDPSSKAHVEKMKKVIASRKQLEIKIDTNFYSERELISKLSDFDLLVYPYQKTGESASGAVRHGLSAGRPVVTTPSPIFKSITQFSYPTKGYTADEIATGILETIRKCRDKTRTKVQEEKLHEEISNLSFANIGFRLKNIVQGLLNQLVFDNT